MDFFHNILKFKRRKWTIPAGQTQQHFAGASEREILLEKRLAEIEEQFQQFQAKINQSQTKEVKNKGKGKKSVVQNEDIADQIDKEARKRLRSFLECERSSTSSQSSFPRPSAPPNEIQSDFQKQYCDVQEELTAEDKEVFIKKIEVLLNGSPIDQVEDKQNVDECIQAYWRMFTFNGQMNSLFTNGIRLLKKLSVLFNS